ncbi:MAG: 7-cyano-7-deazaguanine synthase QueC [Candidatus Latescibacterota bacterium]|jgi:7-cyano-7-deazaguanine synthase
MSGVLTADPPGPAVLLLSGGMDSATLLWWLKAAGAGPIHALSVDYGQRHCTELEAARRLASLAGVAHRILSLDLRAIGGSPLVDAALAVPAADEHRQAATVVPFRNLLFAGLAAAWAEPRGIRDLYLAPVQDDQAAYRDCRRAFYDSLEQTLGLGATRDHEGFRLHTPFVNLPKREVLRLGLELGVPYAETHTCYEGTRPACGRCDACMERITAFQAQAIADPIPYAIPVTWSTGRGTP